MISLRHCSNKYKLAREGINKEKVFECSRRTSDKQELEGAARAGLEERGQMSSRQEVKVEHKVSVAAFTSREEKWVGDGREEETTEERWEGEREHMFRLKVSGRGVGGTQVGKCNLNVMKKWSELCSGVLPKCCLQYNCLCKLNQVGCLICACL